MAKGPTTIDEYLEGVPGEQRAALAKLRQIVRAAAPEAEECISYQLAAFRLHGRVLVGFGAMAQHCAFFPMSGTKVETYAKELADFETSKGTIRFSPDRPIPMALIKKIVKERAAENLAAAAKKPVKLPVKKAATAAPKRPAL